MKQIEVERPSAKQLCKLRNGHPVRLKKGEGLILVVHPGRYDLMSKTFLRGKARTVELSPEELMANMKIAPEAHQEQQAITENKSPKEFKIDKTVTLKPPNTGLATGAGIITDPSKISERSKTVWVSNAGGPKGLPIRTMAGTKEIIQHLGKIGDQVGQNYTGRTEAALGSASQIALTAEMGRMGIETARQNHLLPRKMDIEGEGLFAGRSVMFGRGHKEVSSVCVGGNLLGNTKILPPALQSQPYGANWQLQFTLPPSFHRFNGGK
jgi:hypothetical protein